jgi:pilus assembly protein FimV
MVRVRKLVLAIAAASSLGSGMAHALGLGDVALDSALNQPLSAKIEIVDAAGLSSEEVITRLASAEDFARAGVDRDFFLSDIKFTPVVMANGRGTIRVTSSKPVREPYLNFLVEVIWPNGRLLREYTLLLDPPLYSPETAMAAAPRMPVAAAPASAPVRSAAPATSGWKPAAPATASPQPGGTHRTGSTDTLWQIAAGMGGAGTVNQRMLAIQDLNPNAFISGNINRLKSGQVLRLPDSSQITRRSSAEATAQVAAQNNAWRQPAQMAPVPAERQIDATRRDVADAAPAEAQPADTLRLVAADSNETDAAADKPAANESQVLTAKLAVTQESLDTFRRDSDELKARVGELQAQLAKMESLLALKDDQMAQLQAQIAARSVEEQVAASAVAPAAEAGTDVQPDQVPAKPEAALQDAKPAAIEVADTAQGVTAVAEQAPAAALDAATAAADATPTADAVAEGQTADKVDSVAAAADAAATAKAETEEAVAAVADGAATAKAETEEAVAAAVDGVAKVEAEADDTVAAAADGSAPAVTAEDAAAAVTPDAPVETQKPKLVQAIEPVQIPATPVVVPKPVPAAETGAEGFFANPLLLGGAAAGLLALLLLMMSKARKNAVREEETASDPYSAERDQPQKAEEDFELPDDTFDSLLDESETQAAPANDSFREPTADALVEADAYIAYGKFSEAEQVLNKALNDQPERSDLRLKLMEVLGEQGDSEGFLRQELELADIGGVADQVEQVKARYPAMLMTAAAVTGAASLASADDLPDFEFAPVSEDSEAQKTQEMHDPDDEFAINLDDLDAELAVDDSLELQKSPDNHVEFDDFALDIDTVAGEAPAQSQPLEDAFGLDLNLDEPLAETSDSLEAFNLEFSAEPATTQPVEADFSLQLDDEMQMEDLQQSPMDMPLDTEPASFPVEENLDSGAVALEDDGFDFLAAADESATKLDLARAYVDMGDPEGARDLLDEVLAEGSESQQQEARELLGKLV